MFCRVKNLWSKLIGEIPIPIPNFSCIDSSPLFIYNAGNGETRVYYKEDLLKGTNKQMLEDLVSAATWLDNGELRLAVYLEQVMDPN